MQRAATSSYAVIPVVSESPPKFRPDASNFVMHCRSSSELPFGPAAMMGVAVPRMTAVQRTIFLMHIVDVSWLIDHISWCALIVGVGMQMVNQPDVLPTDFRKDPRASKKPCIEWGFLLG